MILSNFDSFHRHYHHGAFHFRSHYYYFLRPRRRDSTMRTRAPRARYCSCNYLFERSKNYKSSLSEYCLFLISMASLLALSWTGPKGGGCCSFWQNCYTTTRHSSFYRWAHFLAYAALRILELVLNWICRRSCCYRSGNNRIRGGHLGYISWSFSYYQRQLWYSDPQTFGRIHSTRTRHSDLLLALSISILCSIFLNFCIVWMWFLFFIIVSFCCLGLGQRQYGPTMLHLIGLFDCLIVNFDSWTPIHA